MSKNYSLVAAACALACCYSSVYGETAGGTGEPRIQLQFTSDQRVILSMSEAQSLTVGSADLSQGYAELPLDTFNSQSTQSDWGRAQVLLNCGTADVLIYQQVNGQWQEYAAQQLVVDACVE